METKLTRKFIAEVASLAVFGVGLAGVYILARVLKDQSADLTIALIATVIFVVSYVLGQWVKRSINPPPTGK
ncbi:hypothetical protein NB311A_17711 [Nitrobacter sp. Nb-311A]|uniref:hypothetical protein n=1 Tax=unclassified Nitrobacter TaxID=2620411 RepID=UPI0000685333|nr:MULTISPECIES: hypothetical protein [unclassified Nitrobacter]EAQ34382.1 hypothetical protein NB311A_17711 [Nitrobacter sp. Nb-311A]MCB1391825.1 hypothetical protein [Nitrobacter sp.]MCV0385000.1 hypothetical protein [Nitrobacter sp.]